MSTSLQGSFYCKSSFTVRFTLNSSTNADWFVSAGTTFADIDEALADWNSTLSSISCSVARVKNAANHTATVQVFIPSGTFSINWYYTGTFQDTINDYFGASLLISNESGGFAFSNPLPTGWFPPYGMRRLSIKAEPWDVQRFMTGAGAVTTGNPHITSPDEMKYRADAVFWFGDSSSYLGYKALRDFIEGVLEFGNPFVIRSDGQTYTCRLDIKNDFQLVPTPVENVRRGYIYEVTIPVVVIDG